MLKHWADKYLVSKEIEIAAIKEAHLTLSPQDDLLLDIMHNGLRNPILIDQTYTVIDGHLRLKIMRVLGHKTIPVHAFGVSPEERTQMGIEINQHRVVFNIKETMVFGNG